MDRRLALGVDVGSTSTKVTLVAVDDDGVHELRSSVGATPEDVTDLVGAVATAARSVLDGVGHLDAIGVASMAETGAAVDARGQPLTPLLRWDAGRGADAAARMADQAPEIFAATGVRVAAKVPLATWGWLRDERRGVVASMATWLGAADLVVHALTGARVTDHTLAGRTGGYRLAAPGDAPHRGFDTDLLARVGLTPDRLPRVLDPSEVAGTLTGAVAASWGLDGGTPVVVAGHDHQVAAWATGVREPGSVADSLGTAEAVLSVLAERPEPERVRLEGISLVRTLGGTHDALVAGNGSAGGMLAHWLEMVPTRHRTQVLDEAARDQSAHPAPTGAPVAPYRDGRQAPSPDPAATAGAPPAGWPRPRQARAVVEGICYQARWMIAAQAALGREEPQQVTVTGGARLPRLWLDLKRATLPWPVTMSVAAEPVAAGAALVALARSGVLGDPREALRTAPTIAVETLAPPGEDTHAAAYAAFLRASGA